MRSTIICWSAWFASVCLMPCSSQAAILTGRVVDSAGQPIAGAEVRIWQKVKQPDGPGTIDQPVTFDDGEVLLTNSEGNFVSPDALEGDAFARIVAEAKGTLAGRSGWIEIPPAATVVAPKIALKRLRAVLGQVHDRNGQAIAGAMVFNAGDAHERVETKTGRNGKFFLDGVPEGGVFLFAEKAGYRFTGMRLADGPSEAVFTLATVEETIEPLTSLPPLLSADEERALAREAIAQWLEELLPRSTDEQIFFFLAGVASIDPLEALQGINAFDLQQPGLRAIARDGFLQIAAARCGELAAEKLKDAIESGTHPFGIASQYAKAARHLSNRQRPRQLEWLEVALVYARRVDGEVLRIEALALIADTLFLLGERDRAKTTLAEVEEAAKALPDNPRTLDVYGFLALAAVHVDAERAVEWLDKMKADSDYSRRGAELAMRLLPKRPELAMEVWNRSGAGNQVAERNDLVPLPWYPRVSLPDFCYRLALIDRPRAASVAAAAEPAALRVRGQGAIALALAQTQPAEARRMLESLVHDELPRIAVDEGVRFRGWGSRPTTAACLLPIAERVAPDLCHELFWRSLALRLPRPRHDHFDDEVETSDLQLARMLARYDRAVARALVEPFASRALQMSYAGTTELVSPQAMRVAGAAIVWARELVIAAAHVDPPWAKEIVDRIPWGRQGSKLHPADFARQAFVWTLARHGVERWTAGNDVSAGFWEPRADDHR